MEISEAVWTSKNVRGIEGYHKEVNLDCHALEIIVNTWIMFTVY